MKKILAIVFSLILAIGLAAPVGAGILDPDWSPQSGSRMHTLNDLYYYLIDGTDPAIADTFQEPAAGPPAGGAAWSVESIYDGIKAVFDRSDATPDDVAAGKLFFSAETGSWGIQTGTAAGGGGGLLVTGQTTSYVNYDDAWYAQNEIGTAFSYQTSDPATNGEIVTTDNVTGLMWASDGTAAGCYNGGVRTWAEAITWAHDLTFAGYSDWRLPNIEELYSICVKDATIGAPFINHTMFPNAVSNRLWSSTSAPYETTYALYVFFSDGRVIGGTKISSYYVRAVRGGE